MSEKKSRMVDVDFVSVGALLEAGQYYIPDFQRPYAWSLDHVQEFWSDLLDPNRDAPYFIGPVVVFEMGESPGEFGIVDGQQRLTTLILLLCAIRDLAAEVGADDVVRRAGALVLSESGPRLDGHLSGAALRAAQRGEDAVNIQLRMRGGSQRRLRDAWTEIKLRLREDLAGYGTREAQAIRLDALISIALELRVIRSVLEDSLRAFTFFETLNSKGADLETVDLLKNLLFERRRRAGGDDKSIRDAWDAFTRQLSPRRVAPKTMLYHWWLSRRGYVTKRTMYAAIRAEYVKADAVEALRVVNEMEVAAEAYAQVARPRPSDWSSQLQRAYHLLNLIRDYGVAQPRPFLLSLVLANKRQEDGGGLPIVRGRRLLVALEGIEAFHLVYNAVSKKTSLPEVSRGYADASVELKACHTRVEATAAISGLLGILRERGRLPTREVFVATLVDSPKYAPTRGANRVLLRVLELWNEAHGVEMLGRTQLTIEHWHPRDDDQPWTNSVGNLALLPAGSNVKLGSATTLEKRRWIDQGDVDPGGLYVDDLMADWGREAAEARARQIAASVYDHLERALSR